MSKARTCDQTMNNQIATCQILSPFLLLSKNHIMFSPIAIENLKLSSSIFHFSISSTQDINIPIILMQMHSLHYPNNHKQILFPLHILPLPSLFSFQLSFSLEKEGLRAVCLQYYQALGAMKAKQSRSGIDSVGYSQSVRDFLSRYKVYACPLQYAHMTDWCEYYHTYQDRRRNPYNGYYMSYYPSNFICSCDQQNCTASHNSFENYFHPFVYKTSECFSNCNNYFLCSGVHKKEHAYLQKHQFFRFDLQTFKTTQCKIAHSSNNQYASCRFYHGEGDRRRDLSIVNYSHLQCGERNNCRDGNCPFAHNKIQQLYHPQRYKSKYCSRTLKGESCEYLQFCSFAHNDEEITIQLLHKVPVRDQKFIYYKLKTVWCPFTENHQRANCDYAHNFNDYRRDPIRFKYEMGDCPFWNKNKTIDSLEHCGCEKKMDCNKCHGWFENKYHPDNLLKNADGEDQRNKSNAALKGSQPCGRRQDGLGTGAPFYRIQEKNTRGNSKKTEKIEEKAQTRQVNQEEKSQVVDKKSKGPNKKSRSHMKSIKKCWLFYHNQDGQLWLSPRNLQGNARNSPAFFRRQKRSGSECENKSSHCLTPSFQKLLCHYGLQEKILGLGIHQLTLLSLNQSSLEKQKPFKEWSSHDRKNLILAVSKYNQSDHLQYSQSFVHIFRNHQGRGILEKLQNKKLSQRKLLTLSQNSINKLSFLGEQQKEKLPVILENYMDQRNFKEINEMIKIETFSPT